MSQIRILIAVVLFSTIYSNIHAGSLKGSVRFDGKPPKKKKLRMDADPVCGSAHSGPVFSESFKVNSNGDLAECLVWLRNVEYSGGVPKEPVVIDQKGCIYIPHVFAMQAGQELLIKNSDPTLHNIHSMPKVNKEFNFAMPKVVKEKKSTFEKSEDPFYIKCDVHPWMKSYISVFEHPYFAVTNDTGYFKIENIPPGTYEIIAWQEKFKDKETKEWKTLNETVTVNEGDTIQNFTFVKPSKKK